MFINRCGSGRADQRSINALGAIVGLSGKQRQMRRHPFRGDAIMEEQEGYSALFYFMLLIGIIGVLGFVLVAAGSA